MELFNDLNVGWRHLLWAETSGHKDYPFKRLQDISILKISTSNISTQNFNPGHFNSDVSTLDIFNPTVSEPYLTKKDASKSLSKFIYRIYPWSVYCSKRNKSTTTV